MFAKSSNQAKIDLFPNTMNVSVNKRAPQT